MRTRLSCLFLWGFMKSKRRFIDVMESLCGELGPEDGTHPRKFFSKESKRSLHKKTYQLCKEIQLTLNLTLAGELNDPLLRELTVFSVEPLPESSDLIVVFSWNGDCSQFDFSKIRLAVQNVSGRLRSEVAQAINRKRVPELSFKLLFPGEVKE
jgi:ribosome-binding factor A